MAFLNALYRNGIMLSVPLFFIGAALLVFFITGIIRVGDSSRLASLPLVEEQPVEFREAGRVVLALDGPRLSKRFSELKYELVAPGGRTVSGRTAWFHARTAAISTVRVELLVFDLQVPGQYLLRIRNLGQSREDDGRHKVVFSRPHLFRTVGCILGIILSAALLIGSIVLFSLRLLDKGGAS